MVNALTGLGLDLLELESKDDIVLGVGLRSLNDVSTESEDVDFDCIVDISVDCISFVLSRFEDGSLVKDDAESEEVEVDWLGNKGLGVLEIGED